MYGTNKWDEGWRLSLGLAGVPAVILLLGGLLLPGGLAGAGPGAQWPSCVESLVELAPRARHRLFAGV